MRNLGCFCSSDAIVGVGEDGGRKSHRQAGKRLEAIWAGFGAGKGKGKPDRERGYNRLIWGAERGIANRIARQDRKNKFGRMLSLLIFGCH